MQPLSWKEAGPGSPEGRLERDGVGHEGLGAVDSTSCAPGSSWCLLSQGWSDVCKTPQRWCVHLCFPPMIPLDCVAGAGLPLVLSLSPGLASGCLGWGRKEACQQAQPTRLHLGPVRAGGGALIWDLRPFLTVQLSFFTCGV